MIPLEPPEPLPTALVAPTSSAASPTPVNLQTQPASADAVALPTATPQASIEVTSSATLPLSADATNVIGEASAWSSVEPSGQRVVFWHRYTKFREKILNEIVDDFNQSNEYGIQVVAVAQGDFGDLFAKTIAALGTSDAPQIVIGYQDDLAAYFQSGGLAALDALIDDATWGIPADERSDFVQSAFESDRSYPLGGARLGIAADRSLEALLVNKDWLAELGMAQLPVTPAEFQLAACAASQQPFSRSQGSFLAGYEIAPNATTFANWVFAFGGNLMESETGRLTLNSPAAQEAMRFLQQLVQSGCATTVTEQYADEEHFGNGEILFAVGASGSLYFYGKAVEEGAAFAWELTALPHAQTMPTLNLRGASMSILKSTPEQELAAWLFVKHYLTANVQAKWARATGNYPVRYSAAEAMDKYLAENSAYRSGFALLASTQSEPAVPGYGMVRAAMNDALRAILDGADVASTLAMLEVEANKIVATQSGVRQ